MIQRVSSAKVMVGDRCVGRIESGLVSLVAVGRKDSSKDASYLANKTAGLRVFPDANGRMSRSVRDVDGSILAISQFTLYGDVRRGLRPSFDGAADPMPATELYERYVALLRAEGLHVETGEFGADMQVSLVNDGPVTILLDSSKLL